MSSIKPMLFISYSWKKKKKQAKILKAVGDKTLAMKRIRLMSLSLASV